MKVLRQLLRWPGRLEALRPVQLWYIRRRVLPAVHRRYSDMDPALAFSDIYARKIWGDHEGRPFTSGSGSADAHTGSYCEVVNDFIRKHHLKTIVDIGCGDFRVGSRIARPEIFYTGVDVVPELIAYNEKMFGTGHIRFQCADLTNGSLPDGDLCLIRQVLQHLSNKQIQLALEQCARYRYVIVTEHLPAGRRIKPNIDKPQGPDIRLYSNSGVFLDQPPFERQTMTLLEVPVDKWSVLRTSLMEHSQVKADQPVRAFTKPV